MFISKGREVLQHMLEINKAVKYFWSDSAENKTKCTLMLSFGAFQSQLGKRSNNYFEGSFEKGPRVVPPFPPLPKWKGLREVMIVQNLHESKDYT